PRVPAARWSSRSRGYLRAAWSCRPVWHRRLASGKGMRTAWGRGDHVLGARTMRVLVTGGTGLVGKPACDALRAAGHSVTIVSREPGRVPARAIGLGGARAAAAA